MLYTYRSLVIGNKVFRVDIAPSYTVVDNTIPRF